MTTNNTPTHQTIGFGIWQLEDERQCREAIRTACETGYRLFDTAQIYGNEGFLGAELRQSGIARNELSITTKIWNENQFWDDVLPSFEKSLNALQTDYVDLLLLHFPVTQLRRPAWRRLETIHASGQAKAIGVSNYTIRHLEELLKESEIKPAVNQVELHVYLQQPELVEYCKQHSIIVQAYSPLAHGYGHDHQLLRTIGLKHGKTPTQIMLRWCIEAGAVTLTRSSKQEHIQSNFAVLDFKLDAQDMQQLRALDRNYRTCWDPTHVG